MKNLIFALVSLASTLVLAEELSAYKLTVDRNGKKYEQIAYNFWSGEYPQPVIDVQSKKTGTTTVKGYESVRELKKLKACTIQNAIYHPWSKNYGSLINFYSISGIEDFEATADITDMSQAGIDGVDAIKAGDQLINTYYGSEGMCVGTYKSGNTQKEINYTCDYVTESPAFKVIKQTKSLDEQWLYLKCKEGYNVFVQDKSLLKQPKVKEGEIAGYGEVKAAK